MMDDIKRLIDEKEIVSFDIFDTLLFRNVSRPIDIFRTMDKEILEEYNIKDFSKIRVQAEIDGKVEKNCIEFINGPMKGQDLKQVNTYVIFSTFADMYYAIRDLIEGKSYFDGLFMTEYRELPDEYENQMYLQKLLLKSNYLQHYMKVYLN